MKINQIIAICIIVCSMGVSQNTKFIDPLTCSSLHLTTMMDDSILKVATGFVVKVDEIHYLITNWHVVTGIDPYTGIEDEIKPNKLSITYNAHELGNWIVKEEKLFDTKGEARWIEHHNTDYKIDVVAIPLVNIDKDVNIIPFDLTLAETDLRPIVASTVSIIGFPAGISWSRMFPIWKTGHIATDPDLDYYGKKLILIDATTRGGMSGSPVVLRTKGPYKKKSGRTVLTDVTVTLFMGVFSAQSNELEIGFVWKPKVLFEILNSINN